MAMGLDAFAMNVGAPTQSFALSAVQQLFAAAAQTNGEFKLFFSFDLSADSTFSDHVSLWTQFNTESSYLLGGPNNYPVVSSFSGYDEFSSWQSFKETYDVSLLPNLDGDFGGAGDTSEYYTNPSGYLSEFVSIVDGFFSWESAWPPTSSTPVSISSTGDQTVLNWAHSVDKSYMMGEYYYRRGSMTSITDSACSGLSSLQYKDCCGGEYYRIGESNLPERMAQILDLQPDYAEVITWVSLMKSISNALLTRYSERRWRKPLHWQPLARGIQLSPSDSRVRQHDNIPTLRVATSHHIIHRSLQGGQNCL